MIAVVMVNECANASWWEWILLGCYLLPYVGRLFAPILASGVALGCAQLVLRRRRALR